LTKCFPLLRVTMVSVRSLYDKSVAYGEKTVPESDLVTID